MTEPADEQSPPPLKTDPRYGHFPWWPEDGDSWVHPEDVELARRMIPSERIWRKEDQPGEYDTIRYCEHVLRVRPRLWREAPAPEFQIGDLVEVLPHGMANDPTTGRVHEVLWDETHNRVTYRIDVTDRVIEAVFGAGDLKHVDTPRAERMMRIEPPEDDSEIDQLVEGLPMARRQPPGE